MRAAEEGGAGGGKTNWRGKPWQSQVYFLSGLALLAIFTSGGAGGSLVLSTPPGGPPAAAPGKGGPRGVGFVGGTLKMSFRRREGAGVKNEGGKG